MKEYLASILTVLLVSGLASLLMPEGEGKRGVRVALSLVVLFTVIAPLREGRLENFLPAYGGGAFEEESAHGASWLAEREAEAVGEGIAYRLAESYGVSAEEIEVELTCALEERDGVRTLTVTTLTLHLHGRACMANVPGMVGMVKKELGIECEVIYHRS